VPSLSCLLSFSDPRHALTNETKRNETKRNETKRNETKRKTVFRCTRAFHISLRVVCVCVCVCVCMCVCVLQMFLYRCFFTNAKKRVPMFCFIFDTHARRFRCAIRTERSPCMHPLRACCPRHTHTVLPTSHCLRFLLWITLITRITAGAHACSLNKSQIAHSRHPSLPDPSLPDPSLPDPVCLSAWP
jgi:hypothetical protein